jgi:DNA primase
MQRRQREVRSLIAEAERRGDNDMLTKLIQEKLLLDRRLRDH